MASLNELFGVNRPKPDAETDAPAPLYSDEELLAIWKDVKKNSLDQARYTFERQWHRNILYVLNRQWIEYRGQNVGWKDKRLPKWVPRPVTPKCKETVQAIRAMFTSIKLGVNVRPNGNEPQNVTAAAVSDELSPVLHEAHVMDTVLNEADFWLIVLGNAFYHTFVDYDVKHGLIVITAEQCLGCGQVTPSNELTGAQPVCPKCSGNQFEQAVNPETGEPIQTTKLQGRPATIALSPLEVAFPNAYARFQDLPYVVRLRWRTKSYYEAHPTLKDIVKDISWQKSPDNQSLQLFKSLSTHNDLGVATTYSDGMLSRGADEQEDGIPEYEVWMKPTEKYPEGLVFRVLGDSGSKILRLEDEEAIPGPLPYKDADGNPLWTWAHAGYEQVGGRVLASGALDVIIQKQDILNQLDSMILLIIMRCANPGWAIPKGAEVDKFSAMPGWIMRWNPLTVSGVNAKPERFAGIGPDPSLFAYREQIVREIEELTGTFDIVKGAKPTGVEAFSALQLLVERSQSRFSSVFQARGNAYKEWFKFAIELEREFGPSERTRAIMTPARTWTFKKFQRTQLQGSISVVVEDGSNVPKTSLGLRAAVQQAAGLGMINMADPDEKYEAMKLFGLTRMIPTMDIHVQAALRKHQAFEDWIIQPQLVQQAVAQMQQDQLVFQQQLTIADPMSQTAPPPSFLEHTPLKWHPWYNPVLHRQEFLKWANSDRVMELITKTPIAEKFLEIHLSEIDQALMQTAMPEQGALQPQGAGMALENSNRESTQNVEPSGTREGAQRQGPA